MSKPLRLLLSGFWLSFAVAVIVVALLLSAIRLALPVVGDHREQVEEWVSQAVGQPVRIGGLHASWHGWGPSVELKDVTVLDGGGRRPVLQCASARIDINLPASLRRWQFEPGLLTVRGVHISVERQGDGGIGIIGWDSGAGDMDDASRNALKQWLQRQERLAVEDGVLEWHDAKDGHHRVLQFSGVNLQLRNYGDRHRLDATADLPASLGQRLAVAMDVRGDLFTTSFWQGQVYVRGTAVQLGGWWDGQPPPGLAALDGTADFQLWSAWLNGMKQAEGEFRAHGLHAVRAVAADEAATGSGGHLDLDALSGAFRWQRQRPGWSLDLDRLTLTRPGSTVLPPMQWRVEYGDTAVSGGHDIRIAFNELAVEDALGLLRDAGTLPPAWRTRVAAMAPRGMLHHGYLRYRIGAQSSPLELSGDFSDVTWQADDALPGVQGLAGHIAADEAQGEVTLATSAAAVDLPRLFRSPLALTSAAGRINWHHEGQALTVDASEMSLRNADLALRFKLRASLPRDGGSPFVDLDAHIQDGAVEHLSRYLPVAIMPPATVSWLERAVVNGRVSDGSVRLIGRLADFPFDDPGRGQFDVRLKVGDGILAFAEGWPRLEEIDAALHFHGRRFEAEAVGVKTLGSEVSKVQVAITDMTANPVRVKISGTAQGPTRDVLRYVTETPLRKSFGAYLTDVSGGGRSALQLGLDLPLAKDLPVKVKGTLRFDDDSLLFRDSGIDITHIAGSLNFTDGGVSADALHANLLGQPVTVAAATRPGESGDVISFSARGTADMAALARRYAVPLAAYVEGSAPWQGELRIPSSRDGWAELQINSSLQGVKVGLPPPMAKAADESRPLLVQIPLPLKDKKPLHLRYGDIADAQLTLDQDAAGMRVERGELRFGGGNALLPEGKGLRLDGTLAEFDADQWSTILHGKGSGKAPGAAQGVTAVDMEFGTLKASGRQLDKVRFKAARSTAAWGITIDSDQLQGQLQLADAADAPLVMDLDRLYLPRFKKGGGGEPPPDPRHLPPLDIKAKSFRYGELDLGQLELRASRTAAGLHVDELTTHSPQRDMQIKGDWQVHDGGQQSAFTLAYNGDDAGATLTALGFAGVINGGKVHADMKLAWHGAPMDFELAKAVGSISFAIKDGRLLDVEPGAGRILGLLSVQALPRRLLLDFSDLFRKGFAFDSLAGSFAIEDGNAQTDNLHMVGPSAHIETKGRVGLAGEDYDQRVMVTPNLSAGLPVAGVLAAGVGAGAALLLAEKILKPGIDKITQVEYRVTGPWSNPSVERINGQDRPPSG